MHKTTSLNKNMKHTLILFNMYVSENEITEIQPKFTVFLVRICTLHHNSLYSIIYLTITFPTFLQSLCAETFIQFIYVTHSLHRSTFSKLISIFCIGRLDYAKGM